MTAPPSAYNGRYELRSQVARGGTAQVYLARDLLLDRPVALKVLDPQLSTDRTFVERFRREAQAAANLSHPNIVPVFDWGEADHTYFIVMEYVDGEPLSSIIRTQAPLAAEQSASIAMDISKALAYAHRHGVVHRDVKPGNVLITSDGEVKVTDFGIARAIGADEQITQTGLVMGTATYFSPEQAQGLGVDGRSDLYALGVVLYEMITGRPPFSGDTPVAIAYQHVREIAPTPRSLNPSVPPSLEAIVLQAMAKVPAERYANADDMRADLDRFLRHQPVLAKPPSEYAALVGPPVTATAALTQSQTLAQPLAPTEPKRRSTTPYWIAAAVVLLAGLVGAVVIGARQLGYLGGARYVQVPDVRGMNPDAAQTELRNKHLTPDVNDTIPGSGTVVNTVTAQSPLPDKTARTGSTVYLTVAGPIPTAPVPQVVGLTQSDATHKLQSEGFQVNVTDVSPTGPTKVALQVVAQNPTAQTVKPKGTTVAISVVNNKTVAVPQVAGQSTTQAGVTLGQAGFNSVTPAQQFSQTVPVGTVISTTPPSGTPVPVTTTITLNISEGPGVTVPNLIGQSPTQAASTLTALGLNGEVGATYPTTSTGLQGNVAYQETTAGTLVAPGATVKYRIGRPPSGSGSPTSTTTASSPTTLPPPNTGGNTGGNTPGVT